MEKKAYLVHISGMVQGVGFRHFAYRRASAYGLTGYVKNLTDGRVQVFAEGPEDQLKNFLGDLRSGPSFASVEDVQVEWKEYEGTHDRFNISSGYGY